MKTMKTIKEDRLSYQFENHSATEIFNYESAIISYKDALFKINEAYNFFINTPWGLPQEFENIFDDNINNTLSILQFESNRLFDILVANTTTIQYEVEILGNKYQLVEIAEIEFTDCERIMVVNKNGEEIDIDTEMDLFLSQYKTTKISKKDVFNFMNFREKFHELCD